MGEQDEGVPCGGEQQDAAVRRGRQAETKAI